MHYSNFSPQFLSLYFMPDNLCVDNLTDRNTENTGRKRSNRSTSELFHRICKNLTRHSSRGWVDHLVGWVGWKKLDL